METHRELLKADCKFWSLGEQRVRDAVLYHTHFLNTKMNPSSQNITQAPYSLHCNIPALKKHSRDNKLLKYNRSSLWNSWKLKFTNFQWKPRRVKCSVLWLCFQKDLTRKKKLIFFTVDRLKRLMRRHLHLITQEYTSQQSFPSVPSDCALSYVLVIADTDSKLNFSLCFLPLLSMVCILTNFVTWALISSAAAKWEYQAMANNLGIAMRVKDINSV